MVSETSSAKEFWERKILRWEESRYSPTRALNPFAWTVRGRLRNAEQAVLQLLPPGRAVLELGCGSGILAERLSSHCASYIGIDIADIAIEKALVRKLPSTFQFFADDAAEMQLPWADLTVFLGLTDWLTPDQLYNLLGRVRSSEILLSYTEGYSWSPYRLYRRWMDRGTGDDFRHARSYSRVRIESMLSVWGFDMEILVKPAPHNPGALVWARKI